MTCRKARLKLPGYVEGVLGEKTADRVAAHLAECEACSAEQRKLVLIMRVTASLPKVQCRPGFTTAVLRTVRAAETEVSTAGHAWGLRLAVAGAAAVVLAGVLVGPRLREFIQPAHMEPVVVSRQAGDEFVLPVAGPEERLASLDEFVVWPPAQGRVHVSMILDQNVTPRMTTDQVYVLDRRGSWRRSLRSTL